LVDEGHDGDTVAQAIDDRLQRHESASQARARQLGQMADDSVQW
jgi:hypothetical protein